MYQPYSGLASAPTKCQPRDDARLFRQSVIVVLLCVMAAVMILTGMPARRAAASDQKAAANAESGWSQILGKLEAMVYPAEKS